jgi:hypothetical protein
VTGFVDRLAAMALGTPQPGAARVALPPRFLPPSGAAPFDQPDTLPGDDPAPVPQPPRSAKPQISPRPITAQISPPRSAAHDAGTLTRTVEVAAARPRVETASPLHPLATASSPAEGGNLEAAPAAMPPAPPVTRMAPRPAAAPAPRDLTPARLRPVAPILSAADRIAPPLSDVSVASRIAQPRDERPVVHVTIDRIDVRAPPAAKPEPTARRARPQPAVSLTEYLRGERGSRG